MQIVSIAMMMSPWASWKPAERAAVWPKLRLEADDFQARVGLDEVGEKFVAAVGGCIVNEENFVWPRDRGQHGCEAVIERENGVLFVMDGYHE